MKRNKDGIPVYSENVRGMVEFLLRHGDIVPGESAASPERAQLGAEIHRKYQSRRKAEQEGYTAEKALRLSLCKNKVLLELEGRCDGFYLCDQTLTVEEIKTIEYTPEETDEPEPLHIAQALCYAAMLLKSEPEPVTKVILRIIYIQIHDGSQTEIEKTNTAEEILIRFTELTDTYFRWILPDAERKTSLSEELSLLHFPFSSYRKGQRELAVSVYKTLVNEESGNLYINAPTGIGKTISMLFPALKAMGETEKIFYLTATNNGSASPAAAATMLAPQLPDFSVILLTAKEKLCPLDTLECTPERCPRAAGHYDRINDCLYDALSNHRLYTKERITELAERHTVCPFEMQLDLSLWCDLIIGDYNYLFDPAAKLQRFFGERTRRPKTLPYFYLIDEAHNLPDRAREMYSASISKRAYLEFARLLKNYTAKPFRELKKKAAAINTHFLTKSKEIETYPYSSREADAGLIKCCAEFTFAASEILRQKLLTEELRSPFLELYFQTDFFCKISGLFDENYFAFYEKGEKNDLIYTLFCTNPAPQIQSAAGSGRHACFFSGTLLPFDFYTTALGCDREADRLIMIPSPFPAENRLSVLAADVHTTYSKRTNYYHKIAEYIRLIKEYAEACCEGKGNFMVFFSSYKFLYDVAELLEEDWKEGCIQIQPRTANLAEREAFLEGFQENPQELRIGLCVLGGVFSEGIDLPGSRLSGVIVVGVGLPMVCTERELIAEWQEQQEEGSGFANAYVYPGLNKVLQAAGRVIRTIEDRGFVLLLDNRYFGSRYERLFPSDYPMKKAKNIDEVRQLLFDFKL